MFPITLTINSQKLGRSNEQTRWEFAVNLPKRRPRPPPCCRGWRPLPSCDDPQCIGSASLARSIRIRFHFSHFRHRTGRIRSVSDHRAGRVWRSRHRPKTPNCLHGARDQVPALFRNAIERREASVDTNSGAPITQSTFDMLRRRANPLSLLNWWLHKYDNEDDYALFQV